jgi:hypothetical protein
MGWGEGGRNDPNIVHTYEYNKKRKKKINFRIYLTKKKRRGTKITICNIKIKWKSREKALPDGQLRTRVRRDRKWHKKRWIHSGKGSRETA